MSLTYAKTLSQNKPVVVMFTAAWCGPCKVMKPILTKLKTQTEDWELIIIDIDKNLQDALTMRVRGVPTIYLFDNGNAVDRYVGSPNAYMFNQWVVKSISSKVSEKPNS